MRLSDTSIINPMRSNTPAANSVKTAAHVAEVQNYDIFFLLQQVSVFLGICTQEYKWVVVFSLALWLILNAERRDTMASKLSLTFASLFTLLEFAAAQSEPWAQCMRLTILNVFEIFISYLFYFLPRWRHWLERTNSSYFGILCKEPLFNFLLRPVLLVGVAPIATLGTPSVSNP